LGSASWTTIGWVGPGRAPRSSEDLRDRIDTAGCGWLLDGCVFAAADPPDHRPASASIPLPGDAGTPIGDAALTRDALAAQGVSIAISDVCLASDPAVTRQAMTARTSEATARHLRHLAGMLATCRHAQETAWGEYATWLRGPAVTASSNTGAPERHFPA
jgi:hypothetical protein